MSLETAPFFFTYKSRFPFTLPLSLASELGCLFSLDFYFSLPFFSLLLNDLPVFTGPLSGLLENWSNYSATTSELLQRRRNGRQRDSAGPKTCPSQAASQALTLWSPSSASPESLGGRCKVPEYYSRILKSGGLSPSRTAIAHSHSAIQHWHWHMSIGAYCQSG